MEYGWNIETLHQQADEKFGLKQYEVERKQAIERYIQLVFLAWIFVTLSERADMAFWDERGGLRVRLDHAKEAYLVETLLEITEDIDPSLPQAERRAALRDRVEFFSWTGFALDFISQLKILIQ